MSSPVSSLCYYFEVVLVVLVCEDESMSSGGFVVCVDLLLSFKEVWHATSHKSTSADLVVEI